VRLVSSATPDIPEERHRRIGPAAYGSAAPYAADDTVAERNLRAGPTFRESTAKFMRI